MSAMKSNEEVKGQRVKNSSFIDPSSTYKNSLRARRLKYIKVVLSILLVAGILITVFFLVESWLLRVPHLGKNHSTDQLAATVISDQEFLDTVKFGSPLNIKNMLEVGANPGAVDVNGRNALALTAMFRTDPSIVKILTSFGVNINHKDNTGNTPLGLGIVGNAQPEMIAALLQNGANVNAKTNTGTSILMIALSIAPNNLNLVKSLVNQKATVDYTSPHGVTPLMVALKSSTNPEVIKFLIKNGAKVNKKDDLGFTCEEIFKSNSVLYKNQELRKLIK